jgi:carbonic anhydrase/acetyltransferase-like protein (isoleucine patch superfamily)
VNPQGVLLSYQGKTPRLGEGTWVAPTAFLAGDIVTGRDCSFWPQVAARGDVNFIRIGDATNVQDGSVLHVNYGTFPLIIGSRVSVGHGAILHGCTIADDVLLGMGCRVLDGASVEPFSIVAAGCLVPPGFTVPSGHVVMGSPAKVARPIRAAERTMILEIAPRYVEVKNAYLLDLAR